MSVIIRDKKLRALLKAAESHAAGVPEASAISPAETAPDNQPLITALAAHVLDLNRMVEALLKEKAQQSPAEIVAHIQRDKHGKMQTIKIIQTPR